MNREIMVSAPDPRASKEVQWVYARCSRLTVNMSRFIRSLGWPALGLPINGQVPITCIYRLPSMLA